MTREKFKTVLKKRAKLDKLYSVALDQVKEEIFEDFPEYGEVKETDGNQISVGGYFIEFDKEDAIKRAGMKPNDDPGTISKLKDAIYEQLYSTFNI